MAKILVIGSGPIIIGQAAEFDYAGSQACRALKEEGHQVVLVNSNPATIMTDPTTADRVYIEPLTPEFIEEVIARERPHGLLPTLGGQVGLNLAVELSKRGVLERFDVKILGTPVDTIMQAEDRELFRELMKRLRVPTPPSSIARDEREFDEIASKLGFPLIVRPAYTLGGSGGGIARSFEELLNVGKKGLEYSPIHQVLVEKYLENWKEIEYEVMRDGDGTTIVVCNMENVDPMGVHTGDSVVVAPSQTLTDEQYQLLRSASLRIIDGLRIEGGCNVQFALHPKTNEYYVIEVNPRVSRSSALASKATGYPIARVAAKIAVGKKLREIKNAVTGKTYAAFEPALDYVVVKIPRWPFDKFEKGDRRLTSQMKATGEVMAIGRNFETALLKAIRSLDQNPGTLFSEEMESMNEFSLMQLVKEPNDRRIFAIAEALRRGRTVAEVSSLSGIDPFFVHRIGVVVETLRKIKGREVAAEEGFEVGLTEEEVSQCGLQASRAVGFKMVDTCAAEFEAQTPYFYSSSGEEDESGEAKGTRGEKVVVIGSGPIRIGQGIEFDYSSVHCVLTLKKMGYTAIMVNNNPETVSTDFDVADKLYFEPITFEDVMKVCEKEDPMGLIVQFGGQTAINLSRKFEEAGLKILGTSVKHIDEAEDREKFDQLLQGLELKRPKGVKVSSLEELEKSVRTLRFPLLVRPSYVLGGRAMEIVYNPKELDEYVERAAVVSPEHPLWIDEYIEGKEFEIDLAGDGEEFVIPGIMEHIERAGVHSGDSFAVHPPISLSEKTIEAAVKFSVDIARRLQVKGLLNLQFVEDEGEIFVLEVNPRASRTVPYISKSTGVPLVEIATRCMLGITLKEQNVTPGLRKPRKTYYSIKAPVFSFNKLTEVEISVGPEMKSTGEVMGVSHDYPTALYKAFIGAGISIPTHKGNLLATIADKDKEEALDIVRGFAEMGYRIYATKGTAEFLRKRGIKAISVRKIGEGEYNLLDLIKSGKINFVINTVSPDEKAEKDGFKIRRTSVELNIPVITSLDTAKALLLNLRTRVNAGKDERIEVYELSELWKEIGAV